MPTFKITQTVLNIRTDYEYWTQLWLKLINKWKNLNLESEINTQDKVNRIT